MTWDERRIIVYSPAYRASQSKKLDKKLLKAQAELIVLLQPKQGRSYPKTYDEARKSVNEIIKSNQVKG